MELKNKMGILNKMMGKIIKKTMENLKLVFGITFMFLFVSINVGGFGFAVSNPGLCVNVVVTEIEPNQIDIGEEFVLGINIENCGEDIASDVSFEIISLPTDISVVEDLKTEISQLSYSSSERYISYHMRAKNDAVPGIHNIKMKLNYGDGETSMNEYYDVKVSISGEESDLQIDSVVLSPEQIYVGEVVELDLGIKNFGDGVANNLNIKLDYDLEGISEVSLGSLDSLEVKEGIFKFKLNSAGLINVPVIISYEDDFGEGVVKTDIKLTALEKKKRLNIASTKLTPVLPVIGERVEFVMRIENFGEEEINSIKVSVDHPFSGIKESFIGTLKSGEDGPSILTFIPDKVGEFKVPVTITYRDEFGEESITEVLNISVVDLEEGSGTSVVIGLLVVVICGLMYFNFKTKKSKDKIIKQLMKGKHSNK